jgi:hypothetical protein
MRLWKLWANALGSKASDNSREADIVAIIRSAIVIVSLITNFIIVAGVIRHWN